MAFEEGKAQLVCPSCGAEHTARWSRIPVSDLERIRCRSCQGILYERRANRVYFDVELNRPD
jgi:transposase-like protein